MTDKPVSIFIPGQLPQFIRENDPNFKLFLEAYYEFLEQSNTTSIIGSTIDRAKNFRSYLDIDTTIDGFADKLYSEFMSLIPKNTIANKATLLKNIKQFYTARGTQKSYEFLLRVLFGVTPTFFYPSTIVLKASSGKWFIQESIRVSNVSINSVVTSGLASLNYFANTLITGANSGAIATVESASQYFELNNLISELFLSNVQGEFKPGELIDTVDVFGNILDASIASGIVTDIRVLIGGTGYLPGEFIPIDGGGGSGALGVITNTTSGDINGLTLNRGGAGFLVNDSVIFSGGGGTGALGNVLTVSANNQFHPNTYTINSDEVNIYLNVALANANYGFPAWANTNANTFLANAFSFFTYGPTGPAESILLLDTGTGYISLPQANISGNTFIRELGILGRMQIINGGARYNVGEVIVFTSPPGYFGYAGNANIASVNATGAITGVQFCPMNNEIVGGIGYDPINVPTVTIQTANGTGAQIIVVCTLASGDIEESNTDTFGAILEIGVASQGQGYTSVPTVNLTTQGSGTAQAVADIIQGAFSYPGYYLDDTGFPSGSNNLQDADYYQNFSYVIKVNRSINDYRSAVKALLHPAGTKLWGEYLFTDSPIDLTVSTQESTIVISSSGQNEDMLLLLLQ